MSLMSSQNSISKRCRKFYLEKQKSCIPKKIFFRSQSLNMPRQIQKMVLAVLIFTEGFDLTVLMYMLCPPSYFFSPFFFCCPERTLTQCRDLLSEAQKMQSVIIYCSLIILRNLNPGGINLDNLFFSYRPKSEWFVSPTFFVYVFADL